jgi:ADP-heptose:LPS heptosyltransferase
MNILFITSTRIGDSVLSSGLLDHLIAEHPGARVTIACGVPAAPLFRSTPGVEKIIALEKRPFAGHWVALWLRTVSTAWDLVVDLRASVLTWTLRTKQRRVFRSAGGDTHRVRQLADLLVLDSPAAPRIHLGDEERARARELVPDGGPVLGVGPTANWVGKQWPGERFAEVISRLTGPGGVLDGARVAVFGAESERQMAEQVLTAVPPDRLINLIGKIDILTAGACLERCALFVGNDSGLMHLAGAVGSPVVGVFGPSREALYAPWGTTGVAVRGPCSYDEMAAAPGFDLAGRDNYMGDLDPGPVVEAAEVLLHKSGRRQPAAATEGGP